jgi:hypothetical protein
VVSAWRRVRATLTALLALVVVVSTLAGGTSYLFCSMTDSVVSQCCCEADEDGHPAQAEIQRTSDCCEKKTVGKLPQGFGAVAFVFDVQPALAAPAAVAVVGVPRVESLRHTPYEPTGPPGQRRHAQTQVFLL